MNEASVLQSAAQLGVGGEGLVVETVPPRGLQNRGESPQMSELQALEPWVLWGFIETHWGGLVPLPCLFWSSALRGHHQLPVLALADLPQLCPFAPKLDSLSLLGTDRYLRAIGIFRFGFYRIRGKNLGEILLMGLSETRSWEITWFCAWHSELSPVIVVIFMGGGVHLDLFR